VDAGSLAFLIDSSTVSGQPMTVLSDKENEDGMPMEIDTDGSVPVMDGHAQVTAMGNIVVIPTVNLGFSAYCFQFIDQGASFCTARNCATAHYLAASKTVTPGVIYVAKGITTAFVAPSLTSSALDPHALTEWKSLSLTLPKWNEKFLIATAVLDDLPASTAAIEIQEAFYQNKALSFETPAKRKPDQDSAGEEIPDLLDLTPYSPFLQTRRGSSNHRGGTCHGSASVLRPRNCHQQRCHAQCGGQLLHAALESWRHHNSLMTLA
jgi:hypothetical protein